MLGTSALSLHPVHRTTHTSGRGNASKEVCPRNDGGIQKVCGFPALDSISVHRNRRVTRLSRQDYNTASSVHIAHQSREGTGGSFIARERVVRARNWEELSRLRDLTASVRMCLRLPCCVSQVTFLSRYGNAERRDPSSFFLSDHGLGQVRRFAILSSLINMGVCNARPALLISGRSF